MINQVILLELDIPQVGIWQFTSELIMQIKFKKSVKIKAVFKYSERNL